MLIPEILALEEKGMIERNGDIKSKIAKEIRFKIKSLSDVI
ncbi:hypothetical protein Desca_0794 [Desulfotomaculum nigrificans CO-1-SRB]|uniref:Uncharacterized protein n=1 Tax=Desulfotomaculum nigrificans (strain DSM 14880 / VKM B-2319 / CO-1-SRB) TaxID=868595 RepID=F6B923_DESCC|nr:hypothetical protein [Desulfotomaculum nigrificans]AEF93674.1 hypothetical protein Desca_0794 [Desulfotomaculum nigrificans CO-1-SRB]